ncbi:acid phosphatase/vanadium-dependent haloperoxidase-related protein [Tasmannia lanceolata]|uniref:acid phosphatase/vanadium-dependent haloperoxidase-related protein n=1 Tax=Tasmannia lanceolata TaxID=3420 RepID=UPI004063647A
MEYVNVSTSSRVSIPNHLNPRTELLNRKPPTFFKFNFQIKKPRNPTFSISCKTHSNPQTHQNPCNYSLPLNPLWVLVPVLQNIKDFIGNSDFAMRNSKWVSSNGKDSDYLQCGGFGMALMSTTAMAKVRISPMMATLAANPTFVSGLIAWAIAQSMKLFLYFFVERKWDSRILFSSGGMPSSHSALCMALTTSVALCHGVGDSLFPVCLGFSLIVMYDAIGVRRHAGMQAEVLNMIVEDLFQGHPISQRKLKELLGHTPSQVIAGAILGILVACVCCQGCLIAV